jgi:hypothetical protein
MLRKFVALCFVCMMTVSFVGCGADTAATDDSAATSTDDGAEGGDEAAEGEGEGEAAEGEEG